MIDTQRLLDPSETLIREELQSIESEQEYHNHFAISQSDLKKLERSPRVFREEKLKYEPEEDPHVDLSKHIKMGTMVEQNILEPDRFEENFIEQSEMETPSSPNQKEFVQLILSGEHGMVEAHDKAYANSNPSKASALYEELEDYIEFQNESAGKGVYSQEEKETLLKITGDIMSHKKASRLLLSDGEWGDFWNQLPLMGEIKGVLCKGLLDRVIAVSNDEFYLIDLKVTSKPLYNFDYHFNRRKYYMQFAMYCGLLTGYAQREWNKRISVVPIMVASHSQEPYDTIVRTVPTDLTYQGIEEIEILLERLKWHINEDKWDRRRDYYDEEYSQLQYDKSDIPGLKI